MRFLLVIFAKNILLGVNGLLWTGKCCVKDLLIILCNERGEKAQGQLNNGFSVFYK